MKNMLILPAVLSIVALGAVACGPAAPSAAGREVASATTTSAAPLDGRTFIVDGTNVPAGLPTQIDLAFAAGKLDPSPCREQGLPPIAYTLAADGTFRAERRHDGSFDVWSGRVVGDTIEGSLVSQKDGKVVMNIPFKGRAR